MCVCMYVCMYVCLVYTFILGLWHGYPVPQDWVDAIMLSLYNGKGSKYKCGDYEW